MEKSDIVQGSSEASAASANSMPPPFSEKVAESVNESAKSVKGCVTAESVSGVSSVIDSKDEGSKKHGKKAEKIVENGNGKEVEEEDEDTDEDDDTETTEESPCGRWLKRREEVKYRDVPGIDSAYLAMDIEEGVEVVWNEAQFSTFKKFKSQEDKLKRLFDALTCIEHPNIVRSHNYWLDPGANVDKGKKLPRLIFITEYMSSGSLKQFLRKTKKNNRKFPLQSWKRWVTQILYALSYLHQTCESPIIHGNLTCDTIFIQHNGLVKIGSIAPDVIYQNVKKRKENYKNAHCIAPEWSDDTSDIPCSPCDIFSFGMVALEIAALDLTDSSMTNGGGVPQGAVLGIQLQSSASKSQQQGQGATVISSTTEVSSSSQNGSSPVDSANVVVSTTQQTAVPPEHGVSLTPVVITEDQINSAIDKLEDVRQQDFIRQCLRKDPKDRPTARELLFHPILFEVHSLKLLATHALVNFKVVDFNGEGNIEETIQSHYNSYASHDRVMAEVTSRLDEKNNRKFYLKDMPQVEKLEKFVEDVRYGIYPLTNFGIKFNENGEGVGGVNGGGMECMRSSSNDRRRTSATRIRIELEEGNKRKSTSTTCTSSSTSARTSTSSPPDGSQGSSSLHTSPDSVKGGTGGEGNNDSSNELLVYNGVVSGGDVFKVSPSNSSMTLPPSSTSKSTSTVQTEKEEGSGTLNGTNSGRHTPLVEQQQISTGDQHQSTLSGIGLGTISGGSNNKSQQHIRDENDHHHKHGVDCNGGGGGGIEEEVFGAGHSVGGGGVEDRSSSSLPRARQILVSLTAAAQSQNETNVESSEKVQFRILISYAGPIPHQFWSHWSQGGEVTAPYTLDSSTNTASSGILTYVGPSAAHSRLVSTIYNPNDDPRCLGQSLVYLGILNDLDVPLMTACIADTIRKSSMRCVQLIRDAHSLGMSVDDFITHISTLSPQQTPVSSVLKIFLSGRYYEHLASLATPNSNGSSHSTSHNLAKVQTNSGNKNKETAVSSSTSVGEVSTSNVLDGSKNNPFAKIIPLDNLVSLRTASTSSRRRNRGECNGDKSSSEASSTSSSSSTGSSSPSSPLNESDPLRLRKMFPVPECAFFSNPALEEGSKPYKILDVEENAFDFTCLNQHGEASLERTIVENFENVRVSSPRTSAVSSQTSITNSSSVDVCGATIDNNNSVVIPVVYPDERITTTQRPIQLSSNNQNPPVDLNGQPAIDSIENNALKNGPTLPVSVVQNNNSSVCNFNPETHFIPLHHTSSTSALYQQHHGFVPSTSVVNPPNMVAEHLGSGGETNIVPLNVLHHNHHHDSIYHAPPSTAGDSRMELNGHGFSGSDEGNVDSSHGMAYHDRHDPPSSSVDNPMGIDSGHEDVNLTLLQAAHQRVLEILQLQQERQHVEVEDQNQQQNNTSKISANLVNNDVVNSEVREDENL